MHGLVGKHGLSHHVADRKNMRNVGAHLLVDRDETPLVDGDTEFRCKDCHGTVKLHKQRVATGPASHAEHSHKLDSEYCPSGFYFQAATDGREPRLSEKPVR